MFQPFIRSSNLPFTTSLPVPLSRVAEQICSILRASISKGMPAAAAVDEDASPDSGGACRPTKVARYEADGATKRVGGLSSRDAAQSVGAEDPEELFTDLELMEDSRAIDFSVRTLSGGGGCGGGGGGTPGGKGASSNGACGGGGGGGGNGSGARSKATISRCSWRGSSRSSRRPGNYYDWFLSKLEGKEAGIIRGDIDARGKSLGGGGGGGAGGAGEVGGGGGGGGGLQTATLAELLEMVHDMIEELDVDDDKLSKDRHTQGEGPRLASRVAVGLTMLCLWCARFDLSRDVADRFDGVLVARELPYCLLLLLYVSRGSSWCHYFDGETWFYVLQAQGLPIALSFAELNPSMLFALACSRILPLDSLSNSPIRRSHFTPTGLCSGLARCRRAAKASLSADQALAGGDRRGQQRRRGGSTKPPPGRPVAGAGEGRVPPPSGRGGGATQGHAPVVVPQEGRREVLGAPQHTVRLSLLVAPFLDEGTVRERPGGLVRPACWVRHGCRVRHSAASHAFGRSACGVFNLWCGAYVTGIEDAVNRHDIQQARAFGTGHQPNFCRRFVRQPTPQHFAKSVCRKKFELNPVVGLCSASISRRH